MMYDHLILYNIENQRCLVVFNLTPLTGRLHPALAKIPVPVGSQDVMSQNNEG